MVHRAGFARSSDAEGRTTLREGAGHGAHFLFNDLLLAGPFPIPIDALANRNEPGNAGPTQPSVPATGGPYLLLDLLTCGNRSVVEVGTINTVGVIVLTKFPSKVPRPDGSPFARLS